jgi:hypothetical protein
MMVRWELDGTPTYDRCAGVCYLNGADISEVMVHRGLARDCPRFSQGRYAKAERLAAAEGAAIGGLYPLPAYCRLRWGTVTTMATDQPIARDAITRQAAFDHIRGIQSRDLVLSHEDIARGSCSKVSAGPFGTPSGGSSSHAECPFCWASGLCFREKGGRVWYDDQRRVHQQIFAGDEELD